MIAAYSAQLRLSGYTRMVVREAPDRHRVRYVNAEDVGPSRCFEGVGASVKKAEKAAITRYLAWARTGRTG